MKKFDLLSFRFVMLFLATPLFLFQSSKISAPGAEDDLSSNLEKAVELVNEMREKIDQILKSLKQTEQDESKTRESLKGEEEKIRDNLKREMLANPTSEDSTRGLTREGSTSFSLNPEEEDPKKTPEDSGATPPPPLTN